MNGTCSRAAEDHRRVDLVGEHPAVVLGGDLGDPLELVAARTAPVGLCGLQRISTRVPAGERGLDRVEVELARRREAAPRRPSGPSRSITGKNGW